jgi:hypothetical protein
MEVAMSWVSNFFQSKDKKLGREKSGVKRSASDSAPPSVSDVEIGTRDFKLAADKDQMRGWRTPSGDAVMFFLETIPPPFPFGKNTMQEFIACFQEKLSSHNVPLVECATCMLDGYRGFSYIMKHPQEGGGLSYCGDVSIPFREHYYHYRIECKEHGITGARESKAIADALLEGRVEKDENEEGLLQIRGGPNYEDKKYDDIFPEHPLSRVRQLISHVHETVSTSDKLANFEKPEWPRDVGL